MKVEFNIDKEEERIYLERVYIEKLVNGYLDEIKEIDRIEKHKKDGDIFGRKIAFTINKEIVPPYENEDYYKIKGWTERLILEPIRINEVKLEIKQPEKKKYTFRERIKILFKGEI